MRSRTLSSFCWGKTLFVAIALSFLLRTTGNGATANELVRPNVVRAEEAALLPDIKTVLNGLEQRTASIINHNDDSIPSSLSGSNDKEDKTSNRQFEKVSSSYEDDNHDKTNNDDNNDCPSTRTRRQYNTSTKTVGSFSRLFYKDPLECWLWNLKVLIPDQSFKEGLLEFALTGMTCTHFVLRTIDSKYINPSDDSHDGSTGGTISMSLRGIAATCTGQYHGPLYSSGTVTASIGNGSTMNMNVQFHPDAKHYFMTSLTLNQCDTSGMHVSGITFDGSLSAKFINLFSGPITDYVTQSLATTICPNVKPTMEQQAKAILQQVNLQLKLYIQQGVPASYDPPLTVEKTREMTTPTTSLSSPRRIMSANGLIEKIIFEDTTMTTTREHLRSSKQKIIEERQISSQQVVTSLAPPTAPVVLDIKQDTPLLYNLLTGMNLLLSRITGGGRTMDRRCGSSTNTTRNTVVECGVNSIIRLLTNGTGTLNYNDGNSSSTPLWTFNQTINGFGNLNFTLHKIGISGLDQLDEFTLLNPSQYRPLPPQSVSTYNKSHPDVVHTIIDSSSDLLPDEQPYCAVTGHLISSSSLKQQTPQPQTSVNTTMELTIRVDPIPGGSIQGDSLEERFVLEVDVSQIQLMLRLVFGLHRHKVFNLPLGTLLNPTTSVNQHSFQEWLQSFSSSPQQQPLIVPAWKCLLDTVMVANVTDLGIKVKVGNVSVNPVNMTSHEGISSSNVSSLSSSLSTNEGILDHHDEQQQQQYRDEEDHSLDSLELALDQLTNHFVLLFISEYSNVITDSIYGIVQGMARQSLNEFVMDYIHNETINNDDEALSGYDNDKEGHYCTMIPNMNSSSWFLEMDRNPVTTFLHQMLSGDVAATELNQALQCMMDELSSNTPSRIGSAGTGSPYSENDNDDNNKNTIASSTALSMFMLPQPLDILNMEEVMNQDDDTAFLPPTMSTIMPLSMSSSRKNLVVRLTRLEINHLNSLYDLVTFQSDMDDHYHAIGSLGIGNCSSSSSSSLSLSNTNKTFLIDNRINDSISNETTVSSSCPTNSTTLNITIQGSLEDVQTGFRSEFNMTLMIGNLLFQQGIYLKFNTTLLDNLLIQPLTNNLYCSLVPFETFQLYNVDPSIGLLNFVLDSVIYTTSNTKNNNITNSSSIGSTTNNIIQNTTVTLAGAPGFNGLWNALSKLGPASEQFTNEYASYFLQQIVPTKCPNGTGGGDNSPLPPQPRDDSNARGLGLIIGMIVVTLVLTIGICICYNVFPHKPNNRYEYYHNPLSSNQSQDGNSDETNDFITQQNELDCELTTGGGGEDQEENNVITARTPLLSPSTRNDSSSSVLLNETPCAPVLEKDINDVTTSISSNNDSLMNSTVVPCMFKFGIPTITVLTMVLFVSSNVSVGAATFPVVSLKGYGSYELPPSFDFSLRNTILEMYRAGVYALMLLVGMFSGIWPYVKLGVMGFTWVCPTRHLSRHTRGIILTCLDSLNKYSLVDTFVLILMTVVFRISMDISTTLTIDTYVEPLYGFYSFLVATVTSLLLGEIVLFFHRCDCCSTAASASTTEIALNSSIATTSAATSSINNRTTKLPSRVPLQQQPQQEFDLLLSVEEDVDNDPSSPPNIGRSIASRTIPINREQPKTSSMTPHHLLRLRQPQRIDLPGVSNSFLRWIIAACLVVACAMILVGSFLKSFTFDIQGIAGLLVDEEHKSYTNPYSFVTLGLALPSSVMEPNSFGIRSIQFFYFFFALCMPIVCLVLQLVLVMVPLRFHSQSIILLMAELANAWSSMEVFVLSIGVSLWQIARFSKFIIGNNCDLMDRFTTVLLKGYMEDATCFSVVARASPSCLILVMGTILCSILSSWLLHLSRTSLETEQNNNNEVGNIHNYDNHVVASTDHADNNKSTGGNNEIQVSLVDDIFPDALLNTKKDSSAKREENETL